jgi:hypothetical protein
MKMKASTPNSTSEKQRIEKASAEVFLRLLNNLLKTEYQILSLGDSPDVHCLDSNTNLSLSLEITLLEDMDGEIAYSLDRREKPLVSPVTSLPCTSFSDDSIPKLEQRLAEKSNIDYGSRTALVIRQISPLWFAEDWERYKLTMDKSLLVKSSKYFEAGIWIICTNNDSWPATDEIYALVPPKYKMN